MLTHAICVFKINHIAKCEVALVNRTKSHLDSLTENNMTVVITHKVF